jgi:hypothetical protein
MNGFTNKIVKIFCESVGTEVDIGKLYSPEWKIKETLDDLRNNKPSMTSGAIRVSKIGNGRLFVLDGNHRVVEAIKSGKTTIPVEFDNYIPDMTRTGGGYLDMIKSAVRIVDKVKLETIVESVESNLPVIWYHNK